jgi:hypothetical protein
MRVLEFGVSASPEAALARLSPAPSETEESKKLRRSMNWVVRFIVVDYIAIGFGAASERSQDRQASYRFSSTGTLLFCEAHSGYFRKEADAADETDVPAGS